MKAHDLELLELLEVDTEEGSIRFKDRRMLLWDADAFGSLRFELIESLGLDMARPILKRFGFANGYRDVHNHLATGAQELCKDSFDGRPILASLPGADDAQNNGQQLPTHPPLDYAPKSTPYERGTLNEEYGLEKEASTEQNLDSPTPDAVLKNKE